MADANPALEGAPMKAWRLTMSDHSLEFEEIPGPVAS